MRISGIRPEHVRFGFSPARECLRGIAVLLHPQKHAEQTPWLRDARRRLPRRLRQTIEHFRFFFEPRTEVFPFLWDYHGQRSFNDELRTLHSSRAAYRDAVVRRLSEKRMLNDVEMRRMRRLTWYRNAIPAYAQRYPYAKRMLEQFVDSPQESLREYCTMLREFHEFVFAPAWEPIDARLAADIQMRRNILRDYGISAMLRTLGTGIIVNRGHGSASIEVEYGESELTLDARSSVTLTPSFFSWPGHEIFIFRSPRGLQCTIAYPVPPLTAKTPRIGEGATVVGACAALGDPLRLRILELLNARDLSTRELAGYLKIAEPVASRHLRALLQAQLVQRRRSGYFVMYTIRRDTVALITAALSSLA